MFAPSAPMAHRHPAPARLRLSQPSPCSISQNLSGDTAATYIVDGLADEIATRLGQLRRLTVTSRAAVRHLPNTATMSVPPPTASRVAPYELVCAPCLCGEVVCPIKAN